MLGKIVRQMKSKFYPVMISDDLGHPNDQIDTMSFINSFSENPDLYETTMRQIYSDAKSDADIAGTLRVALLEENVADSFDFYSKSTVPQAIIDLMALYDIGPSASLVDVGCGRGHGAFALHKRGFSTLCAMDPNSGHLTGTGYLASLGAGIRIVNTIDEWRSIKSVFDAAISTATVHHWGHIPHVAIDLRRTLKPGGYWFMITEWFANNPSEFYELLNTHPFAKRYGTYEWPYPASAYADLIQSVGFDLVGVVPLHYDNNKFFLNQQIPSDPELDLKGFTNRVEKILRKRGATVEAFWNEVDEFRSTPRQKELVIHNSYIKRFYTNPQVMIFRRVAV